MKLACPNNLIHIMSASLLLILAILACGVTPDVNVDTAATAVQQTVQAAAQSAGEGQSSGLQPISPQDLTATSAAAANQGPAAQDPASPTPTAQSLAQVPASATPTQSAGGQQPAAPQPSPTATLPPPPTPTSPPPPTQGPAQPSSATSSYIELYDYDSSSQGVDLDNSGGLDEMGFFEYDSNDPFPGNAVGQLGGRGTVWADVGTSAPTYQTCTAITTWHTGIFISQGQYYCYITDQQNYGYMRVDRLEQIGTGGSEIQPWVLGISFTTWLP